MGRPNDATFADRGVDIVNSLMHYGVPGMKWGKRKGESSVEKAPASSDHAHKVEVKTQRKESGVQSLTNAQLSAAIKRAQLEQQYNQLNPTKVTKGKKVAVEILSNAAKQIATEQVKKYASQGLDKVIKKAMESAGA